MKNLLLFSIAFLCLESYSQKQSFPASTVYSYGIMAGTKNSQDAVTNYQLWKSNFVEKCNNARYRVKFDTPSETVSEGIGYGMLLAVYATDKELFDGFWLYYKDNVNSNGVMNWKINGCSGTHSPNGATDAELDVAFALIVADFQWGSTGSINYKNDAKSLITTIKLHEIEANTFVLKPGDQFGGSQITNPSYFSPAYYRAFGAFTNDVSFWNSVAAKSYTIINNNLTVNNAVGGLVSDWCTAAGTYSSEAGIYKYDGKTYNYDAVRTPWRIAVDYVWYGTADAKTYVKKSSDFVRVNLGGTSNIKDGYSQDGSLVGQWHNATFVGAFACAAMGGDNQIHLNESYTDLKNLNEPNSYFNQTLKTLYTFLLTGNFYLPSNATLSNDNFDIEKSTVTLFPNPSADRITVNAPERSTIYVISASGSIIHQQKSTSETTEINLANQASGVYFVKIANDDFKSITKKVILN
ncbi:glycosyl hydrolase family 8 [Flavobacterium reichenbachii]|uniref:cellulase n=1 Tax=Flavobacterium reichenbachii TaxID=362418 RepID=A0A085ZSL1_9FLAO|nr:glycosyl hydrolase family 8 [Flavobacterium reichenbachii]KFF07425.1 licheninase [Flavobacterium reichenbachii]OXB13094.1 licheninase [Flavobacterium reichenbachii]